MNKNKVLIVAVCDRSGSMYSILEDAIGGFDSMIKEQKKIKDKDIYLTLATFDDSYELKLSNSPLSDFTSIKDHDYNPRGATALYDAIGKTIVNVGVELDKLNENEKPSKVLFVIQTDGEENSSTEYSFDLVKELINHQTEKYNWEFIYLGSGLEEDVNTFSKSMGIFNSMAYDHSGDGMRSAYCATSSTISDILLEDE